jgi:hypothetical protein
MQKCGHEPRASIRSLASYVLHLFRTIRDIRIMRVFSVTSGAWLKQACDRDN